MRRFTYAKADPTSAHALALDPDMRRRMYEELAVSTRELFVETERALSETPGEDIDGWLITRVPIAHFGVELRLCESTRADVEYHTRDEDASDMALILRRGSLTVNYDGVAPFTVKPGQFVVLPASIGRKTFAASHPTTVFCVVFGRPGERERISRLLD